MSNVRRYVPGDERAVGQRVDAPLLVGGAAADRRPLAGLAQLEDRRSRLPAGSPRAMSSTCVVIIGVSCLLSTSFASRSRVIFRCSLAAMRNSSIRIVRAAGASSDVEHLVGRSCRSRRR